MIKSLIQAYLAPYETYLWAALAVLMAVGFAAYNHHERAIGEQKVLAADSAARAAAEAQVKKIRDDLQAKADTAEKKRVATQKALDDYMSAHPVGTVLVCSNSRSGNPRVSAPSSAAVSSPSGPVAIPEVPGRSAPRDIGPALDTIVRAASAMAGFYGETQEDYLNAQRQR
jgi:hypothetical protein